MSGDSNSIWDKLADVIGKIAQSPGRNTAADLAADQREKTMALAREEK
ncbi:hypothetical protein PSDVSF_17010 [Pseudodesulfovibrio sediminis]|uniref:PspA/IM30 family protein n=1 Tax=Pseudodesulfovibrio sediminis TaxID=2810563 RepID=A0ABN6ET92_9BACT|nr:hypothetical protein PSDVSF_17010 [Pseudodesulfovibrio sediminis]